MDTLYNIFKALLLIAGCVVLIDIIIAIIVTPIRNKIVGNKRKKELHELANKILQELQKEEENKPKKTTKTTKKSKKNEKN